MSKKLDFTKMASEIIENLGGKENLRNVNHCATRLRVVVKDNAKVNESAIKKINGVMGTAVSNGETQVIVGAVIEDLFIEVEKLAGKTDGSKTSGKKSIKDLFVNFLQLMAGIMSPVIPSLIAAGFITCLLLILNLVFKVETTNSTYVILNNLAQSVFYFLPVFVAYTSAKKFDTEPVLAMLLACFLLYPEWVNMVSTGGFTSYFGIPTLLTTYNGAVLQIILSVFVMSKIDGMLKKYLPISVRHFLKPFLLIVITSVITLTLTGPMGGLITNYIAAFIDFVRNVAPWATVPAIIIFASTVGLLCPGFHLALIPLATTSLAQYGYDDIINIWFFCCTITPGFIALAVALKTKRRSLKEIAFPASLSALFGGISEPTIYGISYKMPVIFLCSTVTSIITAIYAGLVGLKCYGFGGYSLTNILLYMGPNADTQNFIKALIGVAIMAICSFVFVFIAKWDDRIYDEESNEDGKPLRVNSELKAPVIGEFVKQEDIEDDVFASGTLGKCFGIHPQVGEITSPLDGVINSIAPTNHAITIKGDNGAEVMIHIGIDSLKLDNEITTYIKAGDKVKTGQKIAYIDREGFKVKEIKDTVITIILNGNEYKDIKINKEKQTMTLEA